jgi:hypothetical protein
MDIEDVYRRHASTPSDINEHLPTLREHATQCTTIVECGVREVVSSYAFAAGLPQDGKLIMIDPYRSENINSFLSVEPRARFVHESDLTCELVETDMLFIDTWHIYGQLKRELERWHPYVRKYIALHDTEVDKIHGETIRNGWNAVQQSIDTGIPVDEINRGLEPAIDEFLVNHPEWTMHRHYTNNNGLTLLARSVS